MNNFLDVCPVCEGLGVVKYRQIDATEWCMVGCSLCGGSGVVLAGAR